MGKDLLIGSLLTYAVFSCAPRTIPTILSEDKPLNEKVEIILSEDEKIKITSKEKKYFFELKINNPDNTWILYRNFNKDIHETPIYVKTSHNRLKRAEYIIEDTLSTKDTSRWHHIRNKLYLKQYEAALSHILMNTEKPLTEFMIDIHPIYEKIQEDLDKQ